MCNAMRNPPSWIVTYGSQNSIPSCIFSITQYNLVLTTGIQITMQAGNDVSHFHTAWLRGFK